MYNVQRLVRKLEEAELDAVICSTLENIHYISGFQPVIKTLNPYGGHCYAVVLRRDAGNVHVVHSLGEADQILDAVVPIGMVRLYGTFYRECRGAADLNSDEKNLLALMDAGSSSPDPLIALRDLIRDLRLERCNIGVDEDGINTCSVGRLKALLPDMRVKPAAAILRATRQVKTASEIERLTKAAQLTENAIHTSAMAAFEGMSEVDLARGFELALVQHGARPALTMLKLGRSAVGGQRRQRSDIRLSRGDFLWFDCDAAYEGYWADIARVYSFGPASRHLPLFQALHHGQQTAMDQIRPGMTGDDVFHLTMRAVHEAGFPEYRRHHVGHGIGLEPYERPILAPGNTDIIEEGMVLSVEAPYYEHGLGALHIEDPILVGDRNNRKLTKSSGALISIQPSS